METKRRMTLCSTDLQIFHIANRSKDPSLFLVLCPECGHSLTGRGKSKGSAADVARHRHACSGAQAGTTGKGLNLNIVLQQRWGDTQSPHTQTSNVPKMKQMLVWQKYSPHAFLMERWWLEKRGGQVCNAGVLQGNTWDGRVAKQWMREIDQYCHGQQLLILLSQMEFGGTCSQNRKSWRIHAGITVLLPCVGWYSFQPQRQLRRTWP